MSQNTNSLNYFIHDANGQPQMVKVVQTKKLQLLTQTKIKQNPVKLNKLESIEESHQSPAFQPIKLRRIKCEPKIVPVEFVQSLQKVTPIGKSETDNSLVCLCHNGSVVWLCEDKWLNEVLTKFSKQTELKGYTELRYVGPAPDPEPIVTKSEPIEIEFIEDKDNTHTVMSHASRKRHDSDNDPPAEYTTKRRKHADKVGKGLRHFSMKVCEKVRTKGFTSYNEVADELVLEFAAGMHGSADSQQYDQKNIRRRVYDALNVLMAMNIISKEKKEIRWLGLPTNSVQECSALEKEKETKIEQIQKKTQQLQELILQHISFKSLIERNKDAENKGVKPSPSSAIHLPFIVVNTSDKALIDCSISNDKTEYMFNFNKRFHIHDDIDILKRMGLLFGLDKGECSEEDIEKVKSMVPKSLESYVEQMGRGEHDTLENIVKEEDNEDVGEDEETFEGEVDAEEDQDADGNEYSGDSSDVDV